MGYISAGGEYYEGDRQHALDAEVPHRPSADHDWNGSAWVPNAARIAERRRREDIDAAISGDSVVAQLRAMTPAEYDAWWAANVTNAAQAIGVLKRVVRLVCRRLP